MANSANFFRVDLEVEKCRSEMRSTLAAFKKRVAVRVGDLDETELAALLSPGLGHFTNTTN